MTYGQPTVEKLDIAITYKIGAEHANRKEKLKITLSGANVAVGKQ
jgi:hypothetical protein